MSLKRGRKDSNHSEGNKQPRLELSTSGKEPAHDARQEENLPYPDVTQPLPRNVTPTPFQQPTQLATFSYTPDREWVFDNSAMKYYVEPPRGAKLNYGYDQWVKQAEERGRIDNLLKALSRIRSDPTRHAAVEELGVVSWRGVMTKILTAPYEERDGWELNVMSVNGTLYFEEYVSDARAREKQSMNPRQSMQTYYGYAFESYCTSDTPRRPDADPASRAPFGWSGDVNNNVQWCSVVRTKLGNTRILIGGRLIAFGPDTFVELKTSLALRGPQDEARFEKKLLKFYFQSFLLGVPEIVVGFRTPGGVVSAVQSFQTVGLPRLVRDKPSAWDPLLCLDWAGRFLTNLRQSIAAEGPPSGPRVWRVWFAPGSGARLRALDAAEVADVERGEDRVGFLPRWYWAGLGEAEGTAGLPRD